MAEKSKTHGGARRGAGRKPKNASLESKPQSSGPHRWKPGESGNPGGRPAVIREVRDLARAYTVDAMETLRSVMTNAEAPPAARVSAAAHILDRGYGKPQQSILNTIRDARRLTDDELYAYILEADRGEGVAEAQGDPIIAH